MFIYLAQIIWNSHSTQKNFFSFFVSFGVLGIKSSTSHMPGKHFSTWVTIPALFALLIFLNRVSWFCLGQPQTTILLPNNWDYRHVLPHLIYLLKWGHVRIALNLDPSNVCLKSSWDYKHDLLWSTLLYFLSRPTDNLFQMTLRMFPIFRLIAQYSN
jgi:hypothetical protein